MAYGGKGLGRQDGKVYFAPETIPGDLVVTRIVKEKGRYAEVATVKFKTRSPLRGPSGCDYSDSCGGCQWLGVDYSQQTLWKKSFLESSLSRIGKLQELPEMEVMASPQPTGYRNRIRLRARSGANGRVAIGYFSRGSNQLIAIKRCQIASPLINAFVSRLNEQPLQSKAGIAFQLELREVLDDDGTPKLAAVVFQEKKTPGSVLDDICAQLGARPELKVAVRRLHCKGAQFNHSENHLGVDFYTKPSGFQQVHTLGNRRLREAIKAFCDQHNPERVLDLFCGNGNLSLGLHRDGRYILGVEANPMSVSAAQHATQVNDLQGEVRYLKGDACRMTTELVAAGEKYDFVIVDPPREGMGKMVNQLVHFEAEAAVLVSCEPNHFARDLRQMCDVGYRVERLMMFDFFPNTYHLESVAFLRK